MFVLHSVAAATQLFSSVIGPGVRNVRAVPLLEREVLMICRSQGPIPSFPYLLADFFIRRDGHE
jgi:hypothetical protein